MDFCRGSKTSSLLMISADLKKQQKLWNKKPTGYMRPQNDTHSGLVHNYIHTIFDLDVIAYQSTLKYRPAVKTYCMVGFKNQ